MRIGQLAAAAHVSVDTVRFYEKKSLLGPALRLPSGYRDFDRQCLERLRLVRQLQRLGLTLAEIRKVVGPAAGRPSCAPVRAQLAAQLRLVRARRAELQALEHGLQSALRACDRNLHSPTQASCPAISSPKSA